MSSREIAQLTGKRHDNVIRDCDNLNASYEKMGLLKIEEGYYTHPNTGDQHHRQLLLTKMQTMDLMTGYSVELRIRVNRRWEELEKTNANHHAIPQSFADALMLAAKQAKEIEDKDREIAAQRPKVLFAESVEASVTCISIADMAKILKQNGVEIGQNRFFEWLRKNGFLINRYGTDYNTPTQKAMSMGLFQIKETSITHSDGHITVSKTAKVTGKGQTYFVDKFLSKEMIAARHEADSGARIKVYQ